MNADPLPAPGSPFDGDAASYDAGFTNTTLGRRYRDATWRRFDTCWVPGQRLLEVGCGTGEDAVHLARRGVEVLATDASAAMVAVAAAKVARAGLADWVATRRLAVDDVEHLRGLAREHEPFDGLLSNFGGLNCVVDLPAVVPPLAALLRHGAVAVVCVMGRLVPWEWGWFLAKRDPASAFRRLARQPQWRGMALRYPSPGRLQRAFAPHFVCRRTAALGALLPLPAAEAWAVGHPGLTARLDRWERRWETSWPLPWLADHYVVELVRR